MMGDTKCPYCDGTADEHDPSCGTLLPPITGTIDIIEELDDLSNRPKESQQ